MTHRDACGGEDVAIEAGEGVGAEAVGEQVIAADALVGDADVAGGGRVLQACGEDVGPAVVAVGGGAVAVGDGVAEGDDGGCAGERDCTSIAESWYQWSTCFGVGQVGWRRYEVAVDVVGGGARAGMAGLAGGRRVEMEGDGEVGQRRDGKVERVGDELGAGRNGDIGAAGEGERRGRWRGRLRKTLARAGRAMWTEVKCSASVPKALERCTRRTEPPTER